MDDGRLKLNRPALLAVPVRDAEALLDAGDGDGALLYLYLVKEGGVLDMDRAARALRLSVRAVRGIAGRLERLGLLRLPDDDGPEAAPRQELPEYQAADVARRSQSDPAFQDLVKEVQQTLGRVLSSTDLKKLFGIYDDLALPPEVIMLLIQHCKEEHDERYGATRNLGFAAIEKEAYVWFDRELMTYDLAESYLAQLARRKSLAGQIQRAIGIRNRELSATEKKYVMSWIDLGFGPEALALAADRTVTNTGELKWRYMNSIVQSWHSKGLHTVEEIEKGDRRGPDRPRPGDASASAPDAGELERMRKLRQRYKNSGG